MTELKHEDTAWNIWGDWILSRDTMTKWPEPSNKWTNETANNMVLHHVIEEWPSDDQLSQWWRCLGQWIVTLLEDVPWGGQEMVIGYVPSSWWTQKEKILFHGRTGKMGYEFTNQWGRETWYRFSSWKHPTKYTSLNIGQYLKKGLVNDRSNQPRSILYI